MTKSPNHPEPVVMTGEAWADNLLSLIASMPQDRQAAWQALSVFARSAKTAKPTDKWLQKAKPLLESVGFDEFNTCLKQSLQFINKGHTAEPVARKGYFGLCAPDREYHDIYDKYVDGWAWKDVAQFNPYNVLTLKGFLWCVLISDPTGDSLAHTAAKVADTSLKKIAGIGVKDIKLANTSVYVLGQMTNESALTALVFLDTTVTFKTTLAQIKKALSAVAERLGLSYEDLLEIGVPTFGLQTVGGRTKYWGQTSVSVVIDDKGSHLQFVKNGKVLKSAPADVKTNFANELKQLKAITKDMDKNITSIATRLDGLMISERSWTGGVWQERYLNHVLTGTVARRLIWVIDGVPAFFDVDTGKMSDIDNKAITVQKDSVVKLFHPIDFDVATVLTWREKLFAKNIKQPFKQAWREVYLLTDAERNTDFYSNRFAGHVLKQHQFNQLASLRGWRAPLRLCVDDTYNPPLRQLDEYGLRAEYWVEGVGGDYGVDTTGSGAYLRVRTDQLRFYRLDAPDNWAHASGGSYSHSYHATANRGVSLDDLPPKVLSEIMRDVDLFVGVASIGNDPTWADGGESGAFREYWQSYGFGELTASAKSRAEYLSFVIPRLKIADKLTIDGRFLVVQGKKRSYKIHLGSSNILMLPNDEYLCIIPSSKKTTDVNLDFSGDRVFSLILSKAMLLVDDDKITDVVILNQINRPH